MMTKAVSFPTGVSVRNLFVGCAAEALRDAAALAEALDESGKVSRKACADGWVLSVLTESGCVFVRAYPAKAVAVVVCCGDDAAAVEVVRVALKPGAVLEEKTPLAPRLQETLVDGHEYSITMDALLEQQRGAFQELALVHTLAFGNTLVLDGFFQVSERGDEYYHEPLVHVPMLSHAEPKRVLICGGGDGGAARDVLRHPSVESCTIVEIDPDVVAFSREHLGAVHRGALDDARVRVEIADAAVWIAQTNETFDVIILDTTDPQGCGEVLFTNEFYGAVRDRLASGGWASLHVSAPLCFPEDSRKAAANVHRVFESVFPYRQFVPLYSTVMGFMLVAAGPCERVAGAEASRRAEARGIDSLQVLNERTWDGLFAIEPALDAILRGRDG